MRFLVFGFWLLVAFSVEARSPRHRARIAPEVVQHVADSGATDWRPVNRVLLFAHLEGVVDNLVLYPMRAAQNAGTGALDFTAREFG